MTLPTTSGKSPIPPPGNFLRRETLNNSHRDIFFFTVPCTSSNPLFPYLTTQQQQQQFLLTQLFLSGTEKFRYSLENFTDVLGAGSCPGLNNPLANVLQFFLQNSAFLLQQQNLGRICLKMNER